MLEEQIYQDYLEALRSKHRHKIDFLSFVRSSLKNQAINLKKERLENEEVLTILKKEQKRLKDAKECITSSNRADLIQELDQELTILENYLPKPISDEKLNNIIDTVLNQTNASSIKDMGRVMKEVLSSVGVKADAKKVSSLVREKLSSRQ